MFRRLIEGIAAAATIMLAESAVALAEVPSGPPITIGFSMPLTGGLAVNGTSGLLAMQIWAEDTNAKGGLLGRPVKLVYYDDQTNPSLVPGIYTKLLDVDKVDLVVSAYGTNVTAPALPVVIQHNKTFIGLFAMDVNEEFRYPKYFSMLPVGPDPRAAISEGFFEIVKAHKEKLGLKTIALAVDDGEATRNTADGARVNLKKAGLQVIYDRTYPPTTTDFTPIIRAIQAGDFYASSGVTLNEVRYAPESRVLELEIEPQEGGVTKLTVVHDQLEGAPKTAESVAGGWPYVLSGLKTLLETGEPLASS